MNRDPADEVIRLDHRRYHFRADAVGLDDLLLRRHLLVPGVEGVVHDEGSPVLLQPPDRRGVLLVEGIQGQDRMDAVRQRLGGNRIDVKADAAVVKPHRGPTGVRVLAEHIQGIRQRRHRPYLDIRFGHRFPPYEVRRKCRSSWKRFTSGQEIFAVRNFPIERPWRRRVKIPWAADRSGFRRQHH